MAEPGNMRPTDTHPYLIKGLKHLIADLPDNLVMAEIGCYKGESTRVFLESGKVLMFYAVDIWVGGAGTQFADAEPYFDRAVAGYDNMVKLKMNFEQALPQLPPLDFIYIDADHSYEWVKRDIATALKIIKPGGIIAGHDYDHLFQGVINAVNEALGPPDKTYIDTSWLKRL